MKKISILILSVLMIVGAVLPSVSFTYANEQTIKEETVNYKGSKKLASGKKLLYGYLTDESAKNKKFKLKGNTNKALFNILLRHIKAIAEGNENSTEINVAANEIGLADQGWTLDELGIDETKTCQAFNKIASKIGFDGSNLLDALLCSCPYELYWYDKSIGCYLDPVCVLRDKVYLDHITFSFMVSKDYRANGAPFTVDGSKMTRVNEAKENANKIVADDAKLSDYQRLVNYRDAICRLVTYNTDAMSDDVDYGDPWQIISVFDNDPNTNVVCEGYAKAFKYLCDLSTFTADDLDCILVSGSAVYHQNIEGHMWNLVTMDDDQNYLVDVTNCDDGDHGNDSLFLIGDTLKTGSPSSGYTVTYNSDYVQYIYDSDTLSDYDDSALTLNTENYKPKADGHTHIYGDPTFSWSSDHGSAAAIFKCADQDSTKTVIAQITAETTPATEDAEGKTDYLATVIFNGKTYTDAQTVILPKLEHIHTYGDPTFIWTADYSSAVAAFKCVKGDDEKKAEATVTVNETPATQESEGKDEYVATALLDGKTYTDTRVKILAKLAKPATTQTDAGNTISQNNDSSNASAGLNKMLNGISVKKVKLTQVKIKSVKNQKGRKVKVTFKKVKKAKIYQISYRMKGKKKWVTKTVSKTSFIIRKLKKKKYYIRVRAVNGKSYGKWSKTKALLIRK